MVCRDLGGHDPLPVGEGRGGGGFGLRSSKGFALPICSDTSALLLHSKPQALQGQPENRVLQALSDQVKPPDISLHSNTLLFTFHHLPSLKIALDGFRNHLIYIFPPSAIRQHTSSLFACPQAGTSPESRMRSKKLNQ